MLDMLNLTNTAKKLSHSELLTDTLTERPSSLTCVSSYSPVQPNNIEELRTWLVAAFHANHSQLPESKQAQTMPETCGQQQPTLFAQSDLPAFSWKTYKDYCNSTTAKIFSLTLPKWGMWDATALYPLPTAVLDTDDNDCGLLDNAPDGINFHHTPNTTGMDGGSNSRRALAKRQANWPTPDANMGARGTQPEWKPVRDSGHTATYTINQAVRDMYPTPTAHLAKETGAASEYGRDTPSLTSMMFESPEQRNGLALNPDWVEWLMGWPVGWSDIKPLTELTWRDWQTDPADTGEVPRVTDVKENRANRLKAIGNGQVAVCVVKAWELLA